MFYSVSKITSVNFAAGSALTSIGNAAFYNCSNLTVINYRGTEAEWNAITKGSGWKANCPAVIVYNYAD
ncbi:MAG: leucine-rich repeat domain-containing protein [Clostridiales bacterium]|nr:leucine-rich repeat domain-containing protein [Clostridiales bacterium]